MSDYQQIALHFYHEIEPQIQGTVGQAFGRQYRDVLDHIENTIQTQGPEMASSQLAALASYSQSYSGRSNPFLGDIFVAMNEMVNAEITPGSMEWRLEIQNMSQNHLIRTASVDDEARAVVHDNAQPNVAEQASHPLMEALQHNKRELSKEIAYPTEPGKAERLTRTIGLIERDLQALNPPTVKPTQPEKSEKSDKPELSPEQLERQQTEDKLVMDSIAAYDAQHLELE